MGWGGGGGGGGELILIQARTHNYIQVHVLDCRCKSVHFEYSLPARKRAVGHCEVTPRAATVKLHRGGCKRNLVNVNYEVKTKKEF